MKTVLAATVCVAFCGPSFAPQGEVRKGPASAVQIEVVNADEHFGHNIVEGGVHTVWCDGCRARSMESGEPFVIYWMNNSIKETPFQFVQGRLYRVWFTGDVQKGVMGYHGKCIDIRQVVKVDRKDDEASSQHAVLTLAEGDSRRISSRLGAPVSEQQPVSSGSVQERNTLVGTLSLIIQAVMAIGTFLAVVVAILSHSVHFAVLRPRFRISCDLSDAEVNKDKTTTWIHLKIEYIAGRRLRWLMHPRPATNCRVMLRSVDVPERSNTNWSGQPVIPPLQFCWPFERSKDTPSQVNVAADETIYVDFVELQKDKNLIVPMLYQYNEKFGPNSKEYCVQPCVCGRYEVYLVCDQQTTRPQTFGVRWDGSFPQARCEVAKNVTVEDVSASAHRQRSARTS